MSRQDKIPSRLNENKKLEKETKLMEQRLSLLKSALNDSMPKPHDSTGRFCGQLRSPHNGESGDPLWSASRMATTYESIKRRVENINPSKLKLKTLKHESTGAKSPKRNVYSEVIQRLKTQLNNPEANLHPSAPFSNVLKCGQCEAKEAAVACQECSENYCARCFAHFHMKGALRRHHSLPLSLLQNCHRTTSQPVKEGKTEGLHVEASTVPVQTNGSQTGPCCTEARMNCAAQTDCDKANGRFVQTEANVTLAGEHPVVPDIHFTPAISYAERLMLRLHRRGQIPAYRRAHPEGLNLDEDDDDETMATAATGDFFRPFVSFNRLHALATADLKVDDIRNLCIVEDVEDLGQCNEPVVTSTVANGSHLRNYPSDSAQDFRIVAEEKAKREPRALPVSFKLTQTWNVTHGNETNSASDELATLDLIKQHLNVLNDAHERIADDEHYSQHK